MTEQDPANDEEFEDDDLELELEPIDPEIIELRRQRTLIQSRKAEDSVDINEVYTELETADPFDFTSLKKFRFSIRHLLILTALLSVALTVYQLTDICNGSLIIFAVTVASGWWFVIRQERRQQQELQLRKQELKARIAAQRAAEDGELSTPMPVANEITFDPPPEQPSFRFSFSLKQMFGAFTAAALLLGFIRITGGEQNVALLLGVIALLGLILHATGFDPPDVVVLSWWILLVLYIVASIMAAFNSDLAAISAPPSLQFEPVLAFNMLITFKG